MEGHGRAAGGDGRGTVAHHQLRQQADAQPLRHHGQEYVPEIKIKDLSQIVLEMLASLNAMNKRKDRLIEITADGTITPDELEDFVFIQQELERISITVETLQLWAEKMLATGIIDEVQYEACRKRHNS